MPVDGYLNFDTKIDTDGFDKGLKNVDKHVKTFGSSIDSLGKKIKTAFNIAAIVGAGKAMITAAADVKAAGSQFEQTFGELQDAAEAAIDRVAEPADILSERLRGSAASIFAFAKTAKMESSTAMRFMEDALQAAADSAAYYDRSIEDTTATLQSFLKGNYANDAALGLSATETTRNAKAMELYGKKFIQLTEAQKQLTLLEMVKDANKLSGAMGQAAREADGWANVTGNLSEVWKQFLGAVGQPVLALAVPVVQQMTAALERMTTWANAAYTALAQVFGWEKKQAKPIQQAAAAQGDLTEAVEETEEAQEGSLASFDEIEVLASGAAKATEETADAVGDSAAIDFSVMPTEEREVDTSWIDAFTKKLQELKAFLDTHIKPALSTVGESLKMGFEGFGEWIDTTLKPALSTVGDSLKKGLSKIGEYIDANVKPKLEELTKKREIEFGFKVPKGLEDLLKPVAEWLRNSFPAIVSESINTVLKLLEPFANWFTNDLPSMVSNVVSTIVGMFGPLGEWFSSDLPGFATTGITLITTVVTGLLEIFTTVFNDIWTLVVDPFFKSFVTNILPMFTQLGTELFKTLIVVFEEVKRAFDTVWNDAIKPVLEFIGRAWSEFWELVHQKWNQWGKPIFESLRTAIKNTGTVFTWLWNESLKPIFDKIMETSNRIWDNTLKPLLEKFLDLVGKLISSAIRIYNEFILPVVGWLGGVFAKCWMDMQDVVMGVWESVASAVGDGIAGIMRLLGGLIDFITGVFCGDWKLAWQGIKDIFGGIWDGIVGFLRAQINTIIGYINSMVSGVVSGINSVIGALNKLSFTVPDWVPGLGGKDFGFNIRQVTAPRIPYLATGAVIPPNREFLAVLGDQKHGTNIEAPLDTIVEAFRAAMREGGARGSQTVVLMLDKRELGRAVIEAGGEEEHRIGVRMVTA